MNVIVTNEKQNELANLDIDIIKSVTGVHSVNEIIEMFKSFFYSRMILDVTALNEYKDINTYEALSKELGADKIIFLLPEGSSLCTPNFLSHLIDLGIYNFTTDLNGVKYLLKKPNTLEDVSKIKQMASGKSEIKKETKKEENNDLTTSITEVTTKVKDGVTIIGFINVKEHAGATTLIYMLKKELNQVYGSNNVVAIEINKNDFSLFNDKRMISVKQTEIKSIIDKYNSTKIIFVDLNKCTDVSFCTDIIYLVEPSTIKLNSLIMRNKVVFTQLANKKVVLNKSLLLNNDVFDFESEAGIKVFYNMPPLDERKRNAVVNDFLSRLGLLDQPKRDNGGGSGRIFGLFRR